MKSDKAAITPEAERLLGTAWVAPGEGSTWRELTKAFGEPESELEADADRRTNLTARCVACDEAGIDAARRTCFGSPDMA